jgi:hypothetical protein
MEERERTGNAAWIAQKCNLYYTSHLTEHRNMKTASPIQCADHFAGSGSEIDSYNYSNCMKLPTNTATEGRKL